jgi:hypothetical protein
MAFNARKLEIILKEVNADLVKEGVLAERVTQDIWTKLMSNLTQVSFLLSFFPVFGVKENALCFIVNIFKRYEDISERKKLPRISKVTFVLKENAYL